MSTLVVPPFGDEHYPTLGPQVVDWIEEYLVYGPGELKGDPYIVTPEFEAVLYRAYEVYPQGHKLAGRRRFKRVAISLRKGTAKTEKGAILSIAEAHPFAPVRCDGFDANGDPVGVGVKSPYIPMVAFSLTQTEDLGYAVARAIVEESDVVDDFDVGMERIMVLDSQGREAGKIVPLGGSPNARDGARTTFQFIDEVHLLHLPRLKKAVNVMQQNLFKRVGADAWMLTTTTAFDPGQGSVAEEDMAYAKDIASGKVEDPRMFYFHRQADMGSPLETKEDVLSALQQATGGETWSGDLDALVSHYFEPNTDRQYFQRVWLNMPVAGAGLAFDVVKWRELSNPDYRIPEGADITLGFDGSRRKDATALVATEIDTGFQQVLGIWTRPDYADDDWEMPAHEIDEAVQHAFENYQVALMFADPPYWSEYVDQWAGEWGDKRVIAWWTNRPKPMAYSVRAYHEAIIDGDITNDGDELFAQHIGNTYRQDLTIRDEDDKPLWILRKERKDSERKIDGAMAGVLSWDARGMAIAKNIRAPRKRSGRLVSF